MRDNHRQPWLALTNRLGQAGNRTVDRSAFVRALFLPILLMMSWIHSAAAQQNAPPEVDTALPLTRAIVDFDLYTGQFQAVQRVTVQARVSGYLKTIHFEEGAMVEAGDLLFEIDPRPFQAELEQAEARLQVANAAQRLATVNNERAAELLRRNVGSEADADTRQAEFSRAVADVAFAEAVVAAARLNLAFTRIEAPIGGRISSIDIDVGNLVTTNSVLTRIVSLNPIEFRFTAPEEAYLRYQRLSQRHLRLASRDDANTVSVRLSDEDHWDRKGQMSFIDNALDPNSGTIEGRALFDNGDFFLTPGVYGRLRLPASERYEAVLIPDSAVVSDLANKIVYVVGDGNVVEARVVDLGPFHENMRVVRGGLGPGERIVVRGLQRVRPGQPVTPDDIELQLRID